MVRYEGVSASLAAHLPLSRSVLRLAGPLLAAVAAATLTLAAANAYAVTPGSRPGPWCGGRLWRLMTLSDRDRNRVRLKAVPTTVSAIAALHPPTSIVAARTTPFQRQVWRLQTVLDRYRIASNGEIVLILYSIASGQYMNAYLPNPHCLPRSARDRTGLIAARRSFHDSKCPTVTPQWQLIGVTVDIAGVGFWNPNRTTRGALANGAELRPVTNFRIIVGCGIQ